MTAECREDACSLIKAIWKSIDHSAMSANRRKGIYDELASKIRSAALTSSLNEFVENLCRKFEVRSIVGGYASDVKRVVECDRAQEILETIRSEPTLIVVMLRVDLEKQATQVHLERLGCRGERNDQ